MSVCLSVCLSVTSLSILHTAPQFISSYEVGDYLYLFFREEAIEISDYRVSHSVCVCCVCLSVCLSVYEVGTTSTCSSERKPLRSLTTGSVTVCVCVVFVCLSVYEVGDYLYLFFREEAIEISDYRVNHTVCVCVLCLSVCLNLGCTTL